MSFLSRNIILIVIFLHGIYVLTLTGCSTFSAQSQNAEGVRLLNQARLEEALNQFEQAKQTDPTNPDSYYNCGVVYHEMAVKNGRESDFQMARYYYDQCLDLAPNHPECNRSKAVLLCDMGLADDAFKSIKSWAQRQPASAEPRVELARLYDENGMLSKARDCLNDAVAIDNQNTRALTALGSVRERMGDYQEAINAYDRSLAINPYQPAVSGRVASLRYSAPGNVITQPLGNPMKPQNYLNNPNHEEIATKPDDDSRN